MFSITFPSISIAKKLRLFATRSQFLFFCLIGVISAFLSCSENDFVLFSSVRGRRRNYIVNYIDQSYAVRAVSFTQIRLTLTAVVFSRAYKNTKLKTTLRANQSSRWNKHHAFNWFDSLFPVHSCQFFFLWKQKLAKISYGSCIPTSLINNAYTNCELRTTSAHVKTREYNLKI